MQLADGRVLVAGGNLESSGGGYGLKISFLFDPWTETWVRQPDLVKARWYPTLVRLANGKVAIIAGQDENAINRPEIEVYPAMHGWCPPDSQVYNEEQAEKAWGRLLALFKEALA